MSTSRERKSYEEDTLEVVGYLLERRRQLIQFPMDHYAFYQSLFPQFLWASTPLSDTRRQNLDLVMPERSDIIHCEFSPEAVFHIVMDDPVPANDMKHFKVPEDHEHFAALLRWYQDACLMHADITAMEVTVRDAIRYAKSGYEFALMWPELGNYTKLSKPRLTNFSSPSVRKAVARTNPVDKAARDKIHTALAEAIMLPQVQPRAWVHHNTSR